MLSFLYPDSDEASWLIHIIWCTTFNSNIDEKSTMSNWDLEWMCNYIMQCKPDIMHNILLWVTVYDTFVSDHGINLKWNRLNYHYFPMLNGFLGYANTPSYSNCIHIVNSVEINHWKWSCAHTIA
jgi:hypothetical protein